MIFCSAIDAFGFGVSPLFFFFPAAKAGPNATRSNSFFSQIDASERRHCLTVDIVKEGLQRGDGRTAVGVVCQVKF